MHNLCNIRRKIDLLVAVCSVGKAIERRHMVRERLGIGHVPVEHVHLGRGESVDRAKQGLLAEEVARRIHQQAAMREARGIDDSDRDAYMKG